MIRLQKLPATAGLGSRRAIEEWVRAGRVTLRGQVARLGDRATSADEVRLDGRKLDLQVVAAPSRELLLYYKPVGEVSTGATRSGRRPCSGICPRRGAAAGSPSGGWT